MEELKKAREVRGQRGSSNLQRGAGRGQRTGSGSRQRGREARRAQGQRTSSDLQALRAQRTRAREAQRARGQRTNFEIRQSRTVQQAQWKPIMGTRSQTTGSKG